MGALLKRLSNWLKRFESESEKEKRIESQIFVDTEAFGLNDYYLFDFKNYSSQYNSLITPPQAFFDPTPDSAVDRGG